MSESKKATLTVNDQSIELPLITGTEAETAIDVSTLRGSTSMITYDNGFVNTGSCVSSITFVNGEEGILRYRGYNIEDLARTCSFTEVAFLLIHGSLPTSDELSSFNNSLKKHAEIPDGLSALIKGFPQDSHPMAILSSMIAALPCFYPELTNADADFNDVAAGIMAKASTLAAYSYRDSAGLPAEAPTSDLDYVPNFLNMMFNTSDTPYEMNPLVVDAVIKALILHADHEQNCSTSSVRLVGSGRVNLYSAISAGASALWGPLHGGAAQAVVDMLEMIHKDGDDLDKYVAKAKDKDDDFRLMGFGHRVYKTRDPRATIMKETASKLLDELNISDPFLDLARRLEEVALKDEYFISRNLYPNVDFYSGIIYRAIGFPTDMFTVMFTIARLPGWIAHWKEMADDPKWKIWRPRQVYTGATERDVTPIEQRS